MCGKAVILNGKLLANDVLNKLKHDITLLKENGYRAPALTALLVGNNPSSEIYVKNKLIAASYVDINANVLRFPTISEAELKYEIIKLNNDESVDGILLQLPLPENIEGKTVLELISPAKDVDGFTSANFGNFCLNRNSFVPCTALAVYELIKLTGIDTVGKNAVVCGRSKHVGLPIAMILHSDVTYDYGLGASTTICHRNTGEQELIDYCRKADIIVSATGVPDLIRGNMVKENAIVIDVGISRRKLPNSSKVEIVGDVNFKEVSRVAGFITPVPGGVGPMTVAMLLKNTVTAAQRRISV